MADNNQGNDNQAVGYGKAEAAAGLLGGTTAAHVTGKSFSAESVKSLPKEIADTAAKAEEAFKRANAGMAAEELANAAKSAGEIASQDLAKKYAGLSNPLKRPYVAFKEASTLGKVGMGAAVAVSALGAAWAINAIRNIGRDKSHVEQLEAQGSNSQGHQR